jgi:ribosomal protein L12E/L44/L45/RPP1/RPP2
MSFLDEALKTAAQVVATAATGNPLAGLAAKELMASALEDDKPEAETPQSPEEPKNDTTV